MALVLRFTCLRMHQRLARSAINQQRRLNEFCSALVPHERRRRRRRSFSERVLPSNRSSTQRCVEVPLTQVRTEHECSIRSRHGMLKEAFDKMHTLVNVARRQLQLRLLVGHVVVKPQGAMRRMRVHAINPDVTMVRTYVGTQLVLSLDNVFCSLPMHAIQQRFASRAVNEGAYTREALIRAWNAQRESVADPLLAGWRRRVICYRLDLEGAATHLLILAAAATLLSKQLVVTAGDSALRQLHCFDCRHEFA